MTNFIDITGQRFERLTVIKRSKYLCTGTREALWECQCDCGTVFVTRGSSVRKGLAKSCGCLRSEGLAERNRERFRKLREEKKKQGESNG